MAKLIHKVYGEALFDYAVEKNNVDTLLNDAEYINMFFGASDELKDFLSNPRISTDEKKDTLNNIFKDKVSSTTIDYILLICEKGRTKELKLIFEYFYDLVLKYKNILRVVISSSKALSDDKKKRIEDRIIEVTKANGLKVDYKIDQKLISGYKIKIGDKVFDNSIKTRINDIRKDLRGLKL